MNPSQIDQYLRSLSPDDHLEIIMESRIIQYANESKSRWWHELSEKSIPMIIFGKDVLRSTDKHIFYIFFYEDCKEYYGLKSEDFLRWWNIKRMDEPNLKMPEYWVDTSLDGPFATWWSKMPPTDFFMSSVIKHMRESKLKDILTFHPNPKQICSD